MRGAGLRVLRVAPVFMTRPVGPSLRRTDFVELEPDAPPDAPFTVADGRLHFIVPVDGSYEIRSYDIK